MKNPYSHITMALTYMTSELMESWKEDQLQLLKDQVAARISESDERLWTAFENNFKIGFTNTNVAKDAQRELLKLQQGESLDEYITRFKQLVRLRGQTFKEHRTIEQFKLGLKSRLLDAIIMSNQYNPQVKWSFDKWVEEAQKQHSKWLKCKSY